MSEMMLSTLQQGSSLFLVIVGVVAPLSILVALSTKLVNIFVNFLYGRVRI